MTWSLNKTIVVTWQVEWGQHCCLLKLAIWRSAPCFPLSFGQANRGTAWKSKTRLANVIQGTFLANRGHGNACLPRPRPPLAYVIEWFWLTININWWEMYNFAIECIILPPGKCKGDHGKLWHQRVGYLGAHVQWHDDGYPCWRCPRGDGITTSSTIDPRVRYVQSMGIWEIVPIICHCLEPSGCFPCGESQTLSFGTGPNKTKEIEPALRRQEVGVQRNGVQAKTDA